MKKQITKIFGFAEFCLIYLVFSEYFAHSCIRKLLPLKAQNIFCPLIPSSGKFYYKQ